MSQPTKWARRFLGLAKHISEWSKDPSTQVGAVIIDKNKRVVSLGYNGLPTGVEDSPLRLQNRELKYKIIQHGERNAIVFAKQDLSGCFLLTYPFMPCAQCAGMVIQAGITVVVAPKNDNPRWQEDFRLTEQLFKEAGVELELVDLEETT